MRIILRIKKERIILYAVMATTLLSVVLGGFRAGTSSAISASDFKAGNIISDSIFTAKDSMSAQDIQNFLNSKVPSCDTNGQRNSEMNNYGVPDYNGNGSIQRWEWGKKKYGQTTFKCLKNYSQNGKTAARMIYDNAQKYSISPKVLIVLLQKEQGLITDTWPLNVQYRSATGYGCPDTAACDSDYYGLSNQLIWASKMFRSILNDSPGWYTPYELGNNSIPWNPDTTRCGYSTVNIQNRATQALYNYTPYRPNSAALNSGYGSGDSCSSYGNRNFWLYFNDWFGNTTTPYDAEVSDVRLYNNSSRTSEISKTANKYSVTPGQTVYVTIDVKNIGPKTLSQSFFKVGTTSPLDRRSVFADSSWLSSGRPAALEQTSISTNESGSFLFSMKIPRDITLIEEKFGLVAEGRKWISISSIILPLNIVPSSSYDVAIQSQQLYLNQPMTVKVKNGSTLRFGQKLYGKVVVKNIGSQTLTQGITKIAPTNPHDRSDSDFRDDTWLSPTRIALINKTIATGETGTFTFTLSPPENADGAYNEDFGFLVEGASWMDMEKINVSVAVREDGPILQSGSILQVGESMKVYNRKLVLQGDGNLVLYGNGKALWSTRTSGKGANRLVVQSDGNLVLYNNGKALWSSRTNGQGTSRLVLQGDGNLVLYKLQGRPTWWTGTQSS